MGRRYGQHFLRNRGAIERIIRYFDPQPADRVVEIGAGRGALTIPLAERAGALAAVEIDPALAERLAGDLGASLIALAGRALGGLAETPLRRGNADRGLPGMGDAVVLSRPNGPNASCQDPCGPGGRRARFIVQGNALEILYADLARLLGAREDRPLRVIGNLPYAIATALLRAMIAERDLILDAVFMVQKEVADRILAHPGGRTYGYISVLTALTAERGRVLTLEPGSFAPPPRVRSSVVTLRFHRPGQGFQEEDARIEAVLRTAFSERRKRLAGNLARQYGLDRKTAEDLLVSCGAEPGVRAEHVTPEAFARLAGNLPPLAGIRPNASERPDPSRGRV